MFVEQNKRERLKFVCNLLNIAGWGCLLFWLFLFVLPSLHAQTPKAKQVEARNNTGAMNRAQQAFNLEKGGFADSMEQLGVGIRSQTENYDYSIIVPRNNKSVFHLAIPRKENLKMYVGIVWTVEDTNTKESTTRAILCEREFRFGCGREEVFSKPSQLEDMILLIKLEEVEKTLFDADFSSENSNVEVCGKIF